MTSLTYTEIRERCRTWADVAMSLKPSLPEGFDRVVIQNAISQAGAVIRGGSPAEIIAATSKLQRLVDVYRVPSDLPLRVPAPSRKAKAAAVRAALKACCRKKETA